MGEPADLSRVSMVLGKPIAISRTDLDACFLPGEPPGINSLGGVQNEGNRRRLGRATYESPNLICGQVLGFVSQNDVILRGRLKLYHFSRKVIPVENAFPIFPSLVWFDHLFQNPLAQRAIQSRM